ncbi:MAG: FecR domain-containing protein [Deltaproteobacteria bacterium]|nr:FecR domain-containing protein [Deltaproteobacteria bacterium]
MSQDEAEGADRGAPSPLLRSFAAETAVDPHTAARALARARGQRAVRPPSWGLRGLGVGAGLALAGALLLLRPEPAAPPAAPPAPALAAAAPPLQAELGPGVHEPIPGLRLTVTGQGSLSGTAAAPRLQWRSGAVRVEVDPAAGLDLRLSAPEGEVAVLGTIFSVDRAPLGLAVAVERGKVAARCGAAAPLTLTAGGAHTCLPTSPAGMLARARALQEAGASGEVVLGAVDQGLGISGGSPAVRGELRVVAYEEKLKGGDLDGALGVLDAYLAEGGPRQDELRAAAAGLAHRLGGCARAQPYLPVAGVEPAVAACAR